MTLLQLRLYIRGDYTQGDDEMRTADERMRAMDELSEMYLEMVYQHLTMNYLKPQAGTVLDLTSEVAQKVVILEHESAVLQSLYIDKAVKHR